MESSLLSTGMRSLDGVVGGVLAGDNIVWQVDAIEDFAPFLPPYCRHAVRTGRRLVYFRFAKHPPLVCEEDGAEVHELHPEAGFESFLLEVHRVIEEAGYGAYYVFDCLSDLAADWYSDQMLANFFMLTCPYLFDQETVTYFPILRNHHSFYATSPITDTAQLFVDVHRYMEELYVRPIKVQHRYSSTMYMLHVWRGEEFHPVTESHVISEICSSVPRPKIESGGVELDVWSRAFAEAERVRDEAAGGEASQEEADACFERLLRMAVSRDERILRLARKYFTISDLLTIGRRMVGTGLIGGKSVGMLLSRAVLRRDFPRWSDLREKHDSFYIASDVFYTYLVVNGCWWVRQSRLELDMLLKGAQTTRRQVLRGKFPDFLVKQFSDMLDYYGQSPIIVRSSSLLEDNFGNAFAGKYESVFCANQGPRGKRLEDFMSAVRTIYASTMSEKALRYRARRGLLERDEQMALLVQRVSGSLRGQYYFPQLAGVGLSFNPYVWDPEIDPEAGVMRLVFGLGTRAVDRSDDDFTRLVALNAPGRLPGESSRGVGRCSQRKIDALGLEANQLVSVEFEEIAKHYEGIPMERFATRDLEIERYAREHGKKDVFSWVVTLNGVLDSTGFAEDMREMLDVLQKAYEHPVDVEFTANFLDDGGYRIDLVQCRPLQVQGGGAIVEPPAEIAEENVILRSRGPVIGQSRMRNVRRIIYVVPSVYGHLPLRERYAVARLVGKVAQLDAQRGAGGGITMLMGPGRWGTTTPSLGVPVSFAEISRVGVLCEIVAMREDLVPDVSLGTHFFSEIVETEILYLAHFPGQEDNVLNEEFILGAPNGLGDLAPEASEEQARAVRIVDVDRLDGRPSIKLNANTLKQQVLCYLE